ncbi:hypothetical protein TMatcc_001872 [Talaromyces marneffei ATCC 18224]
MSLDFDWRQPANPTISTLPWPLENGSNSKGLRVKCYRNVIFTWLFHTPVLLNWIEDNHGPQNHGRECFLCRLHGLALRFWSRSRYIDTKFNRDVDKFWWDTHNPTVISNLDEENDVEEYMRSLLGFLDSQSDSRLTRLILAQKQCVKICEQCSSNTQVSEDDFFLQGKVSREDIEYQPLCQFLQFYKLEDDRCDNCDGRRPHHFVYGLLDAPPILVLHCQPHVDHDNPFFVDQKYTCYLSGKPTRLEHSMAFSGYPNVSLDPNTIYWAFYHLYGVILREGDTNSSGHFVCAFEQRQTGRWLFFDDMMGSFAVELTRNELDNKIEEMQKGTWRIFMLMYRRLFQVPMRQLTTVTSSSAIALQNQQTQEELLMSEEEDVADDGLHGDPCNPGTRNVQAEQPMPTERPTEQDVEVEAVPESTTSNPDTEQTRGETQGAADDASSNKILDVQAEQPLPAEENVTVETDPDTSTSKPGIGQTKSRKQASKSAQDETQENENEQTASSQPASKIGRTNVEPFVLPNKKGARSKATKRTHDKALDEDDEAVRSIPASKRARTGTKPSTQLKKKDTRSKATKKIRKDASDKHEYEEAEIPAPSTKRAKTGVEPSTGHGGRETRSRAAAKRARGETPDADKNGNEQIETSKPASRKAKTAKLSAQTSKAQRKK